ncbi:helix-turn-helix domain-containing protein [Marinomonas sp. RS-M-Aa-14]|uniref:helix-turn-helix domain-containing protein n=1 Tax=Marinomonas sp. RS-M-Aa-14 TaxID=3241169 RepID=UPI003AAD7F62
MSQINQIKQTLKQLLRQQQITYKDIAVELNMSEANIKRIFATQNFTLERLEQICQILKMSISDLFLIAQKQVEKISQLTIEQENELLANPKLLLVAVCVRDGWKFDEITASYDIDKHQCIQLLARLDKLKIIDLLPDNHYKSLIAQDFRWRPHGPLEKFMEQNIFTEFMQPKKGETWDFRFYLRGHYSQTSIDIIQRKLNQLTKEAAILNQEDAETPLEKRQHTGLLMAMRPWEPSLFERMRRPS